MDSKEVTQKSLTFSVMISISWELRGLLSDYCDGGTIANSAFNSCF